MRHQEYRSYKNCGIFLGVWVLLPLAGYVLIAGPVYA